MRAGDAKLFPRCKCGRPAPIGKRKCMRCLKQPMKTTQGRASRRGANARGIAAHKPERSRVRVQKFYQSGPPEPVRAYKPSGRL